MSREQYLGLVQISSGSKIYATPASLVAGVALYLTRQDDLVYE